MKFPQNFVLKKLIISTKLVLNQYYVETKGVYRKEKFAKKMKKYIKFKMSSFDKVQSKNQQVI